MAGSVSCLEEERQNISKLFFAMHNQRSRASHAQLKSLKVRLENNQSIVNGRWASMCVQSVRCGPHLCFDNRKAAGRTCVESMEQKVRVSFGRQAFMNTLGAEIVCEAPGQVEIRMPFDRKLVQQDGFVHAGAITAIMDSACGDDAYSVAPEGCNVLTVEFKVSLLAPAVGERFVALAQVKRRGKTLTVCTADAFAVNGKQEKLVASMLGTIMNQTRPVTARD